MIRRFLILTALISSFISCNKMKEHSLEKEAGPKLQKKNVEMKKLGMIGGTSWHSTIDYYAFINQAVNDHYGNNTNPPLLLYTVNQAEVHRFQNENKWDSIGHIFTLAGKSLEQAGAETILFCANTPHKIFDYVDAKIGIPIIHIGDETAKAIKKEGISKVGFIGTKFTMKEDFITARIAKNDIEVIVPKTNESIDELHRIIIDELTYNEIREESKNFVIKEIEKLILEGAEGIILGCTEFPLMIKEGDLDVPIFETTFIHAQSAVEYFLQEH